MVERVCNLDYREQIYSYDPGHGTNKPKYVWSLPKTIISKPQTCDVTC